MPLESHAASKALNNYSIINSGSSSRLIKLRKILVIDNVKFVKLQEGVMFLIFYAVI